MPRPLHGKEFEFTQPDGTKIKVKGWGNQYHAVFETLDGYTVVKDPVTGFYNYAKLSEDANDLVSTGAKVDVEDPAKLDLSKHIRISRTSPRQKANEARMPSGRKCRWRVRSERNKEVLDEALTAAAPMAVEPMQVRTGKYVGLCIPIQFPDEKGAISSSEISDFCNQKGYDGFGNNGSVYDYFYENSCGCLEYTNIVTPYYTAKENKKYYADPCRDYGERASELVKEALSDLKARGFDFSRLSIDGNRYVYAVNILYAGCNPNKEFKGLYPSSSTLSVDFDLGDGRWARDYQITDMGGETAGIDELKLGTFCHENGHMLCDYPDLYDSGEESWGVGWYCLMGYGADADEKNPTQICAYLKYKSGWAKKLTRITAGMRATISAGENDFFVYGEGQREYFMVENRSVEGRDQSLPAPGLAIWHVDERGCNEHEERSEKLHYECSLEQADNKLHLERKCNLGDEGDLFPAQNNHRFSDSTEPSSKWWNGSPSGLDIFDISVAGKKMTFST